ncbi:MAG: V4R domain-containing protein [Aquificaceae bacterium]
MVEGEVLAKIDTFLKKEGVIMPKGPIQEFYSQLLKLAGFGAGALLTFSGKKAGKIAGGYLKNLIGKENPPLEEITEYVDIFLEEAGICKEVSFERKENKQLLVRVKGSIFTEGHESKKPVCMPLSGALSGVFEEIMGGPWECKELECQAQGKEFCLFELRVK